MLLNRALTSLPNPKLAINVSFWIIHRRLKTDHVFGARRKNIPLNVYIYSKIINCFCEEVFYLFSLPLQEVQQRNIKPVFVLMSFKTNFVCCETCIANTLLCCSRKKNTNMFLAYKGYILITGIFILFLCYRRISCIPLQDKSRQTNRKTGIKIKNNVFGKILACVTSFYCTHSRNETLARQPQA